MTMETSQSTVCLTFDFDAISLWLGPFAARSPSAISRGEFGAVGCERILRLLDREGIPATFFVTGHTADTYPHLLREIAAAGHEIGHHGYLHENPLSLETPEREREVLLKGLEALDRAAGVRPTGYRAPSWDNSPWTVELLLEQGFQYESSLIGNDFTPHWCRTGDVIQPDGPYLFGSDVEEIWRGEFTFMRREVPDGVFTLTMHPQVIGRGHRMLMLERLIGWFKEHPGMRFSTLGAAAQTFRDAHPPEKS